MTIAPIANAQHVASITSTSPSGKEFSIGWDLPGSNVQTRSRDTKSSGFDLETNKLEDGIQTLIHVQSPDAPNEYHFPLNLPKGAEIVQLNEGSAYAMGIFVNNELIATVAPPWAHDKTGANVNTSISIDEGILVQRIEHHAGMAYPITADPQIDWGWSKTTVKLSKKETQVTAGAGSAGAIAALPWMIALGATGPVGLAILAAAGRVGFDALQAHRHNRCLGIVVGQNPLSSNFGVSTFEFGC